MAEQGMYEYIDRYGGAYQVSFTRSIYADNGNLAILMYTMDPEYGFLEPFATMTVNIDLLPEGYATIDTNNLGDGIVDWLTIQGIAEPTGDYLPSGFCVYPIVKFNEEWLASVEDENA